MAAQRTLRSPDQLPHGGYACLDLSSVRLLKVPDAAPPFDCEVLPAAGMPEPEIAPWASAARRIPEAPEVRRRPETVTGQPSENGWAQQFACLLVEALAGVRPVQQVLPWMTDRSRVQLRRAAPVLRCGQRPRVLRVLVSWPTDGVAELSVIVGLGPRTRALAVRLEKAARPGQPARWLCTEIETA